MDIKELLTRFDKTGWVPLCLFRIRKTEYPKGSRLVKLVRNVSETAETQYWSCSDRRRAQLASKRRMPGTCSITGYKSS
ncbi:unnamed protein product [Prunus armeniaca]|uniref:Uncharacterized protein n=1 Tax=Prunus armeniaca TaxID=36596 RepID=A0A6J5X0V0_PRUAR|nr:unnamed protein product [Prunus armeniaca]CAB4305612.1 unnamed protein product [Prunus armeniaca]